jgi:hypothetical protein
MLFIIWQDQKAVKLMSTIHDGTRYQLRPRNYRYKSDIRASWYASSPSRTRSYCRRSHIMILCAQAIPTSYPAYWWLQLQYERCRYCWSTSSRNNYVSLSHHPAIVVSILVLALGYSLLWIPSCCGTGRWRIGVLVEHLRRGSPYLAC